MRYFLEISYVGTDYSGFQSQHNANTVQSELEKAIKVLLKQNILLTGSSRTDAGVHALQNYFHFDVSNHIDEWKGGKDGFLYNLNAILPVDIAVKNLIQVANSAHCRFDAISREYKYFIHRNKNPFLKDRSFFYPYSLDLEKMNEAAAMIKEYADFSSFSKKKTQVKTFNCTILKSEWYLEHDCLVYHIKANRFLRGMVRALTATMLKIGRNNLTLEEFKYLIEAKDSKEASFAVPAHGLFLIRVQYPQSFFK